VGDYDDAIEFLASALALLLLAIAIGA